MSGANEPAAVTTASGAGWAAPEAGARRIAPVSIRPDPTAEEAAAIVAAIEALWPRPVVVVPATREGRGAWRFSGRWWARPVSARRPRPW